MSYFKSHIEYSKERAGCSMRASKVHAGSKTIALAAFCILGGSAASYSQQTVPVTESDAAAPTDSVTSAAPTTGTKNQQTLREMVEQRKAEMSREGTVLTNTSPDSLPQLLALSQGQAMALDDIYSRFAAQRIEQEGKIVKWQSDLQKAESPTSFNERKATGLLQSIAGAQRVISDSFIQARGRSIKVLTPSQRLQLQRIAAELPMSDPSTAGAVDARPIGPVPALNAYYQLLLLPAADILQTPVDTQAVRRRQYERNNYVYSNRGRSSVFGSFGIFGGHGHSGFGIGYGHGGYGHGNRRGHH